MARSLPPLSALRAFEAAARHLSFTRAADELGMTQAAVSYQIKLLEERVGAPLFLRGRRQVTLTETGRRFSDACTPALDQIAEAFQAARGTARGVLSITVTSTFAAYWLAPRLGEFHDLHPEIVVKLVNSEQVFDLERDGLDIAIRAGQGTWPGLTSHLLLPAVFTPMASPFLLERMGGVATSSDLLRYPLIDPTDPWWNIWFQAAEVERPGFEVDDGHKMGSQHLEAVAAIAGRGVAILTPFFYEEELASGRLVQLFDLVAGEDRGYWLAYRTTRRNAAAIRAFRDWMLGYFPASRTIETPSHSEGR